jgi:hypothetical protein
VLKKYYARYKYVMNDFKEPNKTMQDILNKHRFDFFGSNRFNNLNNKRNNVSENNNPRKNIALSALKKIEKYHCNTYPLIYLLY